MNRQLLKPFAIVAFSVAACMVAAGLSVITAVSVPAHAASSSVNHSDVPAMRLQVSTVITPLVRLPIVIGGVNLKNGGFEQGPTAWITQSVTGSDPLIYEDMDLLQGTSPHTGEWAAWLGDRNNENAFLRQTVLVPASAPYLIYWQIIASNESGCSADVAQILINDAPVAGSETGLCAGTATKPNWQRRSLDLTAFAGRTVILDFNLKTDGGLPSSWLLDDVAFSTTP